MLVGNFLAVSDRHHGMDRKPGRPNNPKSISIVQFDCNFNSLLEVVVLLLQVPVFVVFRRQLMRS